MSTHDATQFGDGPVVIPTDLLPWLRAAADYELELACDTGGEWSDQIRERVLRAARTISALDSGLVTGPTIERLTTRALTGKDLPCWPSDRPAPEALRAQLAVVHELHALRATARRRVCGRG